MYVGNHSMHLKQYGITQVFHRLQKLMLCMSPDSTLKLIDTMGFEHDATVFQWRDHLYHRLEKSVPEVSKLR